MNTERLREAIREIKMSETMKARIIENTSAAYHAAETERPRSAIRKGAVVLLAAVLALSVSVAAFRDDSGDWVPVAVLVDAARDWLSEYFAGRAGGELTSGQQQFIDEKNVTIRQTATADGYTVTIESAICDARHLFLVIRIEGPEGVRLDMENGEGSCSFGVMKMESTGTDEKTGEIYQVGWGWRPLADGDGKENTVTLLFRRNRVLSADSNRVYTDGEIWKVHMEDLRIRTGEYYSELAVLAEGAWDFEIRLTEMSEEMEMISTPTACQARVTGKEETVEMMVTSFVLSPFGAVCECRFASRERPEPVDHLEVSLEMKDGSVVRASPRSGVAVTPDGAVVGTMTYLFNAPVMLDEVAYLLLPGDVRVCVPEE